MISLCVDFKCYDFNILYGIIKVMKKICFTGYRPFKLPFKMSENDEGYISFLNRAQGLICAQIEAGNTYFISGMARGVDMMLAEIVLEMKKSYYNVYLECAVPFKGQCDNWAEGQRRQYNSILQASDKITILSDTYKVGGYLNRNRYMVDSSDIVIAVFDGKEGGTKFTCDYALKKGKQIIFLNPSEDCVYMQLKADEF